VIASAMGAEVPFGRFGGAIVTCELTSLDVRKIGMAAANRIVASPEDAEDILQSAFVSVLTTAAPWNGESSFTTFFFHVVTNEGLRKVRHDRAKMRDTRLVHHIEAATFVRTADPDSEEQLLLKERASRIRQAIGSLSQKKRDAILATYFEYPELSVVEVAKLMGLSKLALKSRLFWAKRELAAMLVGL
jgi:RNA polymerase sigma-70 factor, ECF subfamily